MTKKKYRSEAFAAIHETMETLHEVGAVDKQTMREFDEACLTPVCPLQPAEIRAIREREHLSQPVFARYLNVSKNLVSDWERGQEAERGCAAAVDDRAGKEPTSNRLTAQRSGDAHASTDCVCAGSPPSVSTSSGIALRKLSSACSRRASVPMKPS